MQRLGRSLLLAGVLSALVVTAACHAPRARAARSVRQQPDAVRQQPAERRRHETPIQQVHCLFDLRPWLNLDAGGDRDPEGIHYSVYLDDGGGKGVHRDGLLQVEMYQIGRADGGEFTRTLVSDWRTPTSEIRGVQSKLLGMGYHVRLRWAGKATAGHEIEVVTRYESPEGDVIQAATKRLRVPKYSS